MADSLVVLLAVLDRGGAETQAVRLTGDLARQGWSCTVVSMMPPGDFQADLERAGVQLVDLDLRKIAHVPRTLLRLVRLLRRRRPRVLLTMTYPANILGKIAGRVAGVPVVVSSIRSQFFGGRLRDLLERATGPLAAATTTNSAAVAAALVARGVVPADRMHVVANAVAEPKGPPANRATVRAEFGLPDGAPVWINVGRLVRAKDQAGLLRTFAPVAAAEPGARLLIVGDGPLRRDLEILAGELGLRQAVVFAGLRHDVPRLLEGADFFVLSSAVEGSPNVLIEAMAAGLPVVTTEVGGAGELVAAGGGGLVVPAGDQPALQEAMIRLMRLPAADRAEMGRAGRDYVRRIHGQTAVTAAWVRLFGDLAVRPTREDG